MRFPGFASIRQEKLTRRSTAYTLLKTLRVRETDLQLAITGMRAKEEKFYYLISRDHQDAIPFDNLHTCMLATTIKHRKNSFCVADPDNNNNNNKKKKKK